MSSDATQDDKNRTSSRDRLDFATICIHISNIFVEETAQLSRFVGRMAIAEGDVTPLRSSRRDDADENDVLPGERVRTTEGEIDDGPLPRWAGLVWLPLILFGLAVVLGLLTVLWRLIF